jgi:hypothetical protein
METLRKEDFGTSSCSFFTFNLPSLSVSPSIVYVGFNSPVISINKHQRPQGPLHNVCDSRYSIPGVYYGCKPWFWKMLSP